MSSVVKDFFSSHPRLATAAGIAGVALIGYTVYFDHQRINAPDYKQKIRQNRKKKQQSAMQGNAFAFPDPRDREGTEQFFFSEIQLGEELMTNGKITEGIFHLSNAVVSCSQPAELLSILQQTMPREHFELLAQALPKAKARQQSSFVRLGVLGLRAAPSGPGGDASHDEAEGSGGGVIITDHDGVEEQEGANTSHHQQPPPQRGFVMEDELE